MFQKFGVILCDGINARLDFVTRFNHEHLRPDTVYWSHFIESNSLP